MAQVPPPKKTTSSTTKVVNKPIVNLQFGKGNFTWLIISIAVVAFGFVLMSGTTDIYSTTKIVIAPVVVLAGFGIGFYSIFKKPEAK